MKVQVNPSLTGHEVLVDGKVVGGITPILNGCFCAAAAPWGIRPPHTLGCLSFHFALEFVLAGWVDLESLAALHAAWDKHDSSEPFVWAPPVSETVRRVAAQQPDRTNYHAARQLVPDTRVKKIGAKHA